jgi:hypothetical protein
MAYPRVVSALSLEQFMQTRGPRGHKWAIEKQAKWLTDASALNKCGCNINKSGLSLTYNNQLISKT